MKYKAILIAGVIGFILFFPFRFNDNQCCLYQVLGKFDWCYDHQSLVHEQVQGHHVDSHCLVQRYIFPFGLMWWLSTALAFWGARQLTENNFKRRDNEHKNSFLYR